MATKFNTIKHIILGTQLEYLLPKVFILESRQGHMEKDEQKSLRALKKSISLN